MKTRHACALALSLCAIPLARPAAAQQVAAGSNVRYYEENGVTYKETHQTFQRQIPETQLQPQSRTVLRGQWKTDTHDIVRTVQVPITEYKMEVYYPNRFNPFVQPTPAYRYVPVTRYEARTEVTKVPVARYEATPTTETYHVPVTTYRTVPESSTHRVAVGTRPAGTESGAVMASRGGGSGSSNFGSAGSNDQSEIANRPANTNMSK
jgi:hypothetical protein